MNLYDYINFDVEHAYEVKLVSCPQLPCFICTVVVEHVNWIPVGTGLNWRCAPGVPTPNALQCNRHSNNTVGYHPNSQKHPKKSMYCEYQPISNNCFALKVLWSAQPDHLGLGLVNFKPRIFLALHGVAWKTW